MTQDAAPPLGRVLVVDDSPTMRQKLSIATRNLGHAVEEVAEGAAALERLADAEAPAIDLVVLDIVMPGMDGFEVLRRMKDDRMLREVPVLVVSSLDRMDDVVRAIELGATDFLTKSFDRLIFKARVTACLEWRRLRRRELDYLAQIGRLTRAAGDVETRGAKATGLGLDDLAARPDALGDFARVFVEVVGDVQRRESALMRQLSMLRAAFLLLLFAISFGFLPPLSQLVMQRDIHPFGAAAIVLTGVAVLLVPPCLTRAGPPVVTPARLLSATVFAIIGLVLPLTLVLWAATALWAGWINIVLASEAVLAFPLAVAAGLERPSQPRVISVVIVACAIGLALVPVVRGPSAADPFWFALPLATAFLLACRTLLIPRIVSYGDSATQTVALVAVCTSGVALPLGWVSGTLPPLDSLAVPTLLILSALVLATAIATMTYAIAARRMGVLFVNRLSAPLILGGVLCSTTILSTRPAPEFWFALTLTIIAVTIVRLDGIASVSESPAEDSDPIHG